MVYNQVRENPGRNIVLLDTLSSGIEERTYQRGLRDLFEKEFLFRSTNPGVFFANIRFMFNGDRLAFVKGYKLKKEQPTLPGAWNLKPPPLLRLRPVHRDSATRANSESRANTVEKNRRI